MNRAEAIIGKGINLRLTSRPDKPLSRSSIKTTIASGVDAFEWRFQLVVFSAALQPVSQQVKFGRGRLESLGNQQLGARDSVTHGKINLAITLQVKLLASHTKLTLGGSSHGNALRLYQVPSFQAPQDAQLEPRALD